MTKRTEGKVKGCISIRESYAYYKENSISPVKYREYAVIIKRCNEELLNQVVNESNTFEIPYRAGDLRIVKYDRAYTESTLNWAVDFKKTKELGFKVFFDQKFIYKWSWRRHHAIVKNKSKYKFTASRKAKRMVPKALANKVDYFKA